jgi:hypothetical protein
MQDASAEAGRAPSVQRSSESRNMSDIDANTTHVTQKNYTDTLHTDHLKTWCKIHHEAAHRPCAPRSPLAVEPHMVFFVALRHCLFLPCHESPTVTLPPLWGQKKVFILSTGRMESLQPFNTYIFLVFFIKTPTVGVIQKGPLRQVRGY